MNPDLFRSPLSTCFGCDFCGRTFNYPLILVLTGGIECPHCGKRIGITGKEFLEEVVDWAKEEFINKDNINTSGILFVSLRPETIVGFLSFSGTGKVIEKTFSWNHYRVDSLKEVLPDTLRTNFDNYKRVEVARLYREDDNINIENTVDIQ